nr:uncharacterized protein DKFZp434B061-like [Penaeus vannamei]
MVKSDRMGRYRPSMCPEFMARSALTSGKGTGNTPPRQASPTGSSDRLPLQAPPTGSPDRASPDRLPTLSPGQASPDKLPRQAPPQAPRQASPTGFPRLPPRAPHNLPRQAPPTGRFPGRIRDAGRRLMKDGAGEVARACLTGAA